MFAKHNLQNELHPQDDYKEFLELIIIPSCGMAICIPVALHHTRWMVKALYCFKIFLFQRQFSLKPNDMKGISDYFRALFAAEAPNQDFQFIKNIVEYESIVQDISKVAMNKLKNHL